MNDRYNRIAGSLIGGAIGDALGYQIEFKRNIKTKEVTRFKELGRISDDTQMTLFTANSLLWRETLLHIKGKNISQVEAIYYGYLDWLETQTGDRNKLNSISWIKNIPELNEMRAPGNTCLSSLAYGKMGTIDNPINNSKGCGTVMRIAPIGLYLNDSKEAGKIAAEASAITHGHPLGIIPSFVMASMISLILNENMSIEDSLHKAIEELKSFDKFNKEDIDYFIDLINKAIDLSKTNKEDIEAIKELGEGWVAEEALAIAIYACLKYSNSFEEAVVCAVNHDGDSDSTGAVTGNIIGTYLGLNNIPDYYINNLELKDTILEISHDLSVNIPDKKNFINFDKKYKEWIDKYVYCKKEK